LSVFHPCEPFTVTPCLCRATALILFTICVVSHQTAYVPFGYSGTNIQAQKKRRLDLQGAVKKLTQSERHKGNLAVIFHTIF